MVENTKFITHMDILRMPSPEEEIIGKIGKCIASAKPDKDKIATIIFKKNTPTEILKLYEKNYDLIPFPAHKEYKIEK
ncbi:hypothetical protein [Lactobacillus kefiranofaciens]|uniref:hypothetical protein n=1 Tax=Lactobacillus kefiranofaciens TaxID=267818 RepID=UPI00166F46A7|nr:hypothetical protein [Lactobacillus kefiranofaciens]MCJ2171288.1 hypothetical protein [Lactobacillus kefiranofaciens]MCP9330016.1 hypothetical protein [Lactobacillus kefiranofaciens]MDF4142018.1 hypothetical protein [Lactobacillus kefiranofaciens]QNT43295.1 hypothetical protein ICI50_05335 [Lactobacillus kefiranofaciens]